MSLLSAESRARIDRAVAKYPQGQQRSAIMAALTIAQDEKGWLANDVIEFVAAYLQLPPMAAYEVASFYSMYDTEPVGRCKITICTNLPCALSGANRIANHLKRKLGVEFGDTTADGQFTLKEGECFGACGDAPVVLLNNKRMVGSLDEDRVDQLIRGQD